MFLKNNNTSNQPPKLSPNNKREAIPAIITQGMHVIGNIVSEGNIDFDGTLDGNIRCNTLTIRANGCVKGDAIAESVFVYGKVRGLIRARSVHLYASCNVEGIIMHEALTIEDGAFVDGKFKRTDKIDSDEESEPLKIPFDDSSSSFGEFKMLENIRLIR